jgi:hypothetical protein
VFPVVRGWCKQVMHDNDIPAANILHAHLAYIFKNVNAEELSKDIIATLLSSQVTYSQMHFPCGSFDVIVFSRVLIIRCVIVVVDFICLALHRLLPAGEFFSQIFWLFFQYVPAKVFLTVHHKRDLTVKSKQFLLRSEAPKDEVDAVLLIPITEMFDLFQRHRLKILNWLQTHSPDCDLVSNVLFVNNAPID